MDCPNIVTKFPVVLSFDEDGDTLARVEGLPLCVSHGRDAVEAVFNLEAVASVWILDCLESGDEIPEPLKPLHENLFGVK